MDMLIDNMTTLGNMVPGGEMVTELLLNTTGLDTAAFVSSHAWSDCLGFGMCLAFLGIYDAAVAYGTPGRWFNVHAMANAVTVLFCAPAILQWVRMPLSVATSEGQESPDPLGDDWSTPGVLFHPSNDWAVLMILAVHTYHCVAFDLSAQDLFHHAMFIPTLGVYGGFGHSWGPIRNCLAFFISGLPGGIDYVNLVRMKNGRLSKLAVKRWASKINVYLRGPGCGVLIPATCYTCWTEGRMEARQAWPSVLVSLFACYNGLYYMEMAVKNYQMHLTRDVMAQEHTVELAKVKQFWQKKEQSTQRRDFGTEGVVDGVLRVASPIFNTLAGDEAAVYGIGVKKSA